MSHLGRLQYFVDPLLYSAAPRSVNYRVQNHNFLLTNINLWCTYYVQKINTVLYLGEYSESTLSMPPLLI